MRIQYVSRINSAKSMAGSMKVLSGWGESDSRNQLGKLVFYHWTTSAVSSIKLSRKCILLNDCPLPSNLLDSMGKSFLNYDSSNLVYIFVVVIFKRNKLHHWKFFISSFCEVSYRAVKISHFSKTFKTFPGLKKA